MVKQIGTFFHTIDIYGTKFHLFMNHRLKFKTCIGGIITFFLSLIGLIFIFIFSNDFFFRKNPSYTHSSIGEDYKKINLTNEKVIIAFRFEDDYGLIPETSKYIFPKIYYYSAIPGEDGEYRSDYKEEYISYRKCVDNDFEGEENLISLYGDLYCIEWENKTFGGFWDNEFLYYFEIRLFYCKNSENYSLNNSICPTIQELNDYFSKQIYFSVYYTTINFRVNDLKKPFFRTHSNYFTYLSHNFRKTDRVFLSEQLLNDDQGWIISQHKNISYWGFESFSSDYKYYDNNIINVEGFSTMFYSINIYMNSNKHYYTRKYMKIADVFSMIGGLLTFFNLIGKVINRPINLSIKKLEFIQRFFDFGEDKKENKKDNKINISNYVINSKSKLINISNSYSTFLNKKELQFKRNYENNSSIFIYNKNLNSFRELNELNNKNNQLKNNNSQISNKKLYSDNKLRKNNIAFIMNGNNYNKKKLSEIIINRIVKEDLKRKLINSVICCCLHKNKQKDIYDITNDIYSEKCDIFNYFRLLKEVNAIKEIFFNHHQINAMEFIKKITINMKNRLNPIHNKQNKIKELINYFKNSYKSKNNSNIDNYIFNQLEEDIKKQINI